MSLSDSALADITFVDADEGLRDRLGKEWGSWASKHMHIDDGFSIVAFYEHKPVALISIQWKHLPAP